MSVKYFILLICLAYYATSLVESLGEKKNDDGTPDEDSEIMFKRADLDDNGKLTLDEMHAHMSSTGGLWTLENIEKMIESTDINGDRLVDFGEFLTMTKREYSREHCKKEFYKMKLNQDNSLSIDQLQTGMDKKYGKVPEEQVKSIFEVMDTDLDGKVIEEG